MNSHASNPEFKGMKYKKNNGKQQHHTPLNNHTLLHTNKIEHKKAQNL